MVDAHVLLMMNMYPRYKKIIYENTLISTTLLGLNLSKMEKSFVLSAFPQSIKEEKISIEKDSAL